jgi:hypothetical protein
MNNPNEYESNLQMALDAVGGEPLTGSGFESEIPDRDLSLPDDSGESVGR